MEDQAKQVVGKASPSRYKNPLGLPRYRKNIYVQLTSNFLRKWWKPKSKAINIIETKVKDWERYLNYWVCWLTLAVFCNFNSNHFSGSCAGKKKKKQNRWNKGEKGIMERSKNPKQGIWCFFDMTNKLWFVILSLQNFFCMN